MKTRENIIMPVISVTVVLAITAITISIINQAYNAEELVKKEEILVKYVELYDKVEKLDEDIYSLKSSYNDNMYRIYDRIMDLCSECPNEIRDAVIVANIKIIDSDKKKFEASVLALVENYPEFNSDIEIQTYLNDNVNILESIEKYESIQDGFIDSLERYNELYLDEELPLEKEKG